MAIFAGKIFTATRNGSRIQSVKCEKCGTNFHYELARVGVGKGSAPYYLGQEGAAKRAAAAAEKNLLKRLSSESEMVPCPKCNWVNLELVSNYRRRLFPRAALLIALLIVLGLVAGLILNGIESDYPQSPPAVLRYLVPAVLAFSLTSPIWVMLIRRQLTIRVDPNLTYPRRPVLPPGTPPALLEQQNPRTGKTELVIVASQSEEIPSTGRWAIFRPGQIRLPPVCCRCLEPATTFYRSPMPINERSELGVPLCASCSGALRVRWWLTALVVAVCSFAIAGLIPLAISGGDPIGRWILAGTLGFFGALVGGIVVAARVCKPYRLAMVDRDRGVMKFAAANPAYTALLIDQVRKSDGVAG